MAPLPRHVCHAHTHTLVIMPRDTWRGYLCSSRFCERAEIHAHTHVPARRDRNRGWNDILLVAREKDCSRGCRRAGRNSGESNWLNARLLLLDDGRSGMNVSAWWNIAAFVKKYRLGHYANCAWITRRTFMWEAKWFKYDSFCTRWATHSDLKNIA